MSHILQLRNQIEQLRSFTGYQLDLIKETLGLVQLDETLDLLESLHCIHIQSCNRILDTLTPLFIEVTEHPYRDHIVSDWSSPDTGQIDWIEELQHRGLPEQDLYHQWMAMQA